MKLPQRHDEELQIDDQLKLFQYFLSEKNIISLVSYFANLPLITAVFKVYKLLTVLKPFLYLVGVFLLYSSLMFCTVGVQWIGFRQTMGAS